MIGQQLQRCCSYGGGSGAGACVPCNEVTSVQVSACDFVSTYLCDQSIGGHVQVLPDFPVLRRLLYLVFVQQNQSLQLRMAFMLVALQWQLVHSRQPKTYLRYLYRRWANGLRSSSRSD